MQVGTAHCAIVCNAYSIPLTDDDSRLLAKGASSLRGRFSRLGSIAVRLRKIQSPWGPDCDNRTLSVYSLGHAVSMLVASPTIWARDGVAGAAARQVQSNSETDGCTILSSTHS